MVDFLEDMRLSEESLDRNAEAYRKIRNTFRYLLGNLNGFDPGRDGVDYDSMEEIDRWALALLHENDRCRGHCTRDEIAASIAQRSPASPPPITSTSVVLSRSFMTHPHPEGRPAADPSSRPVRPELRHRGKESPRR